MQVVPAAAASRMNERETSAPAETSATSTPRKRVERELAHLVVGSGEPHGVPRSARSERDERVDGEAPLLEDAGHLPADGSGGSDDGDLHRCIIVPKPAAQLSGTATI